MKLWQIIVIIMLVLGAAAGVAYSYRATYTAGDGNGYNRRVAEEAQAFKDAEDKGRQDQVKADADTIAQLRQQAADANAAVGDREDDLADANATITALTARLKDAAKDPDGRRWLAEPIPAAVLCRLQQPSSCAGPASGNPSH